MRVLTAVHEGEVERIATADEVFFLAIDDLTGRGVEEAMVVYARHLADGSLPDDQRKAVLAAFDVVFTRAD